MSHRNGFSLIFVLIVLSVMVTSITSLTMMMKLYTHTLQLKFESMKVHYLAESGLTYSRAHMDELDDETQLPLNLDGQITIFKTPDNTLISIAENKKFKAVLKLDFVKTKSGYTFLNWRKI